MLKKAAVYTASLLFLLLMVTNSCSTEVEITAPYKSTPVIIGVLDYTVDTQFVRINRTFLGPGDANSYAAIKDSVEYAIDEVDAWLVKYNGNTKTDSIQLQAIDVPSRDPGAFYDTDVRSYITEEALFTPSEISNIGAMSYELRATLRGKTYRASTEFPRIDLGDINPPAYTFPDTLRRPFAVSGTAVSVPFKYQTRESGARYQGDLILVYDEELEDGTITERKELVYPLGVYINQDGNLSAQRDFDFPAGSWYSFVGNYFRTVPNLKKVRIHYIDHRITAASLELHTYISVASPISTFVPVFDSFTNIDNGAIGILGAKNQLGRGTWLNEASLIYLNNSEFTSGTCYCVYWTGTAYTCDQSATGCP
jgi:hypothetical protein